VFFLSGGSFEVTGFWGRGRGGLGETGKFGGEEVGVKRVFFPHRLWLTCVCLERVFQAGIH